jgi:hypothetical protein
MFNGYNKLHTSCLCKQCLRGLGSERLAFRVAFVIPARDAALIRNGVESFFFTRRPIVFGIRSRISVVPCLGPTIGQHRLMSTCVIVEGLPSERLFPLGERRSRMLSPEREGNTRDFGSRPSDSKLASSSEREASSSLGIAGHLGIRDFVQLLISRPSQRLRSPSYKLV